MAKHSIVLFTRDLRVHDHPALAAAVGSCEQVLPLFVLDEKLLGCFGAPNRVAFLLDSLQDLRRSLEARGGGYVPELHTPDYPDPIVEHTAAVARFRGAAA